MARLSRSVLSKKHLRDDDHKDELTPQPNPCNIRGLEGSRTRKEAECTVVGRWLGPLIYARFLLSVSLSTHRSLVTPDPSNGKFQASLEG